MGGGFPPPIFTKNMKTELESQLESLRSAGDLVRFDGKESYEAYFRVLDRALNMFAQWFLHGKKDHDKEVWAFQPFIDKLLFTAHVLSMKHLHEPGHNMAMDLNESGFPHYTAITGLECDLALKGDVLSRTHTSEQLRESLLNSLFQGGEEDAKLVWGLARRRFHELISEENLFTQFTPGVLKKTGEKSKENRHLYLVTWANYDRKTNLPNLHAMSFEEDDDGRSIENPGEIQDEFFRILKQEGSRAPKVVQLASVIDSQLPRIHPKFLERTCIGPMYAHAASFSGNEHPLVCLLEQFGEPNDFILDFSVETAISSGERVSKGGWGRRGTISEHFYVHSSDPVLHDRQASSLRRFFMVPHDVLQEIDWDVDKFGAWKKHIMLSYDKKGEINDF